MSENDFPPGIYERLLTEAEAARLSMLGDQARRIALQAPDAPRRLAGAVGEFLQRALGAVRGQEEARLEAQVALCNAMIDVIAERLGSFAEVGDRLRQEVLSEVFERMGVGAWIPTSSLAPAVGSSSWRSP